MTTTSQKPIRIGIVGAGPAGLTLARLLQLHNIPLSIFDFEAGPSDRWQGRSLNLNPGSGLAAIDAMGLRPEIDKLIMPEREEMRILDKDARVIYKDEGGGPPPGMEFTKEELEAHRRPEIDRSDLRELLLKSVDPKTVQWGKKAVRVESSPHPILHFDDGTSESFDLIIGADGAWSKIRRHLTDAQPTYSGITFVDMRVQDFEKRFPDLAEIVGGGGSFALEQDRGIIGHISGNNTLGLYACLRVPEDSPELKKALSQDPATTKAYLAAQFPKWNAKLLSLLKVAEDSPIVSRPIYALPSDHSWTSQPGITLIGDAAHVMSPFAGEGVNLAMLDALDLVTAIDAAWKRDGTVKAVLNEIPGFEKKMMERSSVEAHNSARNLEIAFDARAPQSFVEALEAAMAGGGPPE
ncbi:putative monooxygenase [Phlyctochytrium arcticum]|nr:putative monooxygenase [Phlyctochytrium arcticum]